MVYYVQFNSMLQYEFPEGDSDCFCLDYYMGYYDTPDRYYYCYEVYYYCYEYFYICWSELYDYYGYCLDWCEYGYDYETLECYETEQWSIFSESPYKCLDPFFCATTAPGSDASVWTPYEDDEGNEMDYKIGIFEVTQDSSAPCLPWDQYIKDWNQIKLWEGQEWDAVTSIDDTETDASGLVSYQPVTYLCWEGRVVSPIEIDGVMVDVAQNTLKSIAAGNPTDSPASW